MVDIKKQFFNTINNSKNILIVFPKSYTGDALASALALYFFLKKLGKNITIVCDDFQLLEKFNFLPALEKIKTKIAKNKEFIISIDTTKAKIESLRYENNNKSVDIIIDVKDEQFTPKNIHFSEPTKNYDLIITIASPDLESLSNVFEKNTDLFYNTPIINIDKSPINEQYGQINIVKLTASSVAEIIYFLIIDKNDNKIDEKIAELILTGIIDDTNSFKSLSVTPYTLTVVSKLLSMGANREKIIKNLYQVYSVDNLKLWGRVLARLKDNSNSKLVWSLLTRDDFIKTNTAEKSISGVIDELIIHIPKIEIVCLFYQDNKNQIKVIIKNRGEKDLISILEKYKPSGDNKVIFLTFQNKKLIDSEEKIISILKKCFVS